MATATRTKHTKLDHVAINQGLTIVYPDPDQSRNSQNDNTAIDIVAVPGLGANPEFTWTRNKVDWLRDSNMLPRSVTNARIMVFEYESQWFGKGSINQRLSSVADQLIQALSYRRPRGSKRPILFVCHCLGGIVVEKAVIGAQLRQNDYPNIFTSIVGCVFLGTPFRGTKSQSKASTLAELAQTVGLGANSGLLRLLEEGSETLRDLLADFSSLAREANMQLFCFFEQHESDIAKLLFKGPHLKAKELIVEEDSAHIDGYRTGGLASDHFGLNKFEGPKDGGYVSVAGEINAMAQKANGILKSRHNAIRQTLVDDGTYQAILDDLRATDPQKDLQDSIRGRPESQTCWVLTNEHYLKWEEVEVSKVLWIHGDAGKGQPVIATSIKHHLEEQARVKEGVFLAYFFCDEKDSHRRSIRDVLKLLIRQMIWKSRNLTEYLLVDEGKGKKGGRGSQNFDTVSLAALWRSLLNMLNDASVEKVYFLINAFDETDGETRKEFLELLEPFFEPHSEEGSDDNTVIKWLFLSRSGRPDIEKSLSKGLVVCMDDKENAAFVNDGVKRDISAQIDELARDRKFNDALSYLIKRYLYTKADGNYIYAHLVVQELRNLEDSKTNISTIRKFLEDIPYGLTNMFQFIRRRVLNSQVEGIEYTKEILRCLTVTMESPTLFELAMIADLPTEVRNDAASLHSCIRRCGAFLTTITDENGGEIIEWIDVSAKDHLKTYAKEELSLDLSDVQHGVIALRCLEYVRSAFAVEPAKQDGSLGNPIGEHSESLEPQEDNSIPVNEDESDHEEDATDEKTSQANDDATQTATEPPETEGAPQAEDETKTEAQHEEDVEPLLNYAVHYWLEHAMEAPADMVEEFDLSNDFWSEISLTRAAWWLEYSKDTRFAGVVDIMPLHLAAMQGFSALLAHLLENGRADELSKADSWGYTPLAWACDHGDVSSVDRLLKAGANINEAGQNETVGGPTPLWTAAFSGNMEVTQHLLEHGAEVNWRSEGRGTALYSAAWNCNVDVIHLLFQHGGDVNLKGNEHIRPLNIASYCGFIDVVQLLLEHGTEVEPDDGYRYGSALGAAARKGYVDIVRLLLQKGWDANCRMQTYNTPLVAAATYGHAEVVQALLEHPVDGASKIQALDIASKKGRAEVVKCLLAQTPYLPHQKAFHNAASYGRDDILELLEKRGTNPEMLNTALYEASDQERESTVNLLLKFGADPNAEGIEYDTIHVLTLEDVANADRYGNALQAAAFDGSKGIVESLLAYKANVNQRGGTYGTALQAAALYGHDDIAQMLLDHGAEINTEDVGRYGSALQAACWFQNSTLVELLINHGADVNAAGGMYGFPIIAATDEAMQINVEILVNHGANVNVRDARGERPPLLVLAGYTLRKESLERLLDHGADIESADDNGTTVLISVADSGDKESLELLLARGANIHAVSKTLGTALSAAASEGDEECLQLLLDHDGDPNQPCGEWGTALQAAAKAAYLDCINILLEAGAEVNESTETLYGCALTAASFSGDLACVQKLLDAGAEVNLVSGEYGFPLQAASTANHHECLQLLLDHGADVNLEGGPYNCALQAAAAIPEASGMVRTLLDHGARTDMSGGLYGSVMQAAAVGKDVLTLNYLLEHGADAHVVGGKYGNALQAAALKAGSSFVQRILEQNVEVNVIGGKYGTALQAAAYAKDAEVTRLLLEHQANVQLEGGPYGNALNAATRRSNIDSLNVLLEQALSYEMLDEALIQAVYRRNDDAVDVLLKKGASFEARDDVLGSPLELLQKEAAVDNNSDDEEGADGADDESETGEDGDDGEDTDGTDQDDEATSENGGTDNDASVADLQLEDPSTAESNIQRYLEDARSKVKKNPALKRPPTIIRKSARQQEQTNGAVPPATEQYDALGVSKPQETGSARHAYQSFSKWRRDSQKSEPQSHEHEQAQLDVLASNQDSASNDHPQGTQAYNQYQHPPQSYTRPENDDDATTQEELEDRNDQVYDQDDDDEESSSYHQQQEDEPDEPDDDQEPYHNQQYPPSKTPSPPPRPSASPKYSSDPLDFDRLQQKAQKFKAGIGKFWK